jgi:hypothetical protein
MHRRLKESLAEVGWIYWGLPWRLKLLNSCPIILKRLKKLHIMLILISCQIHFDLLTKLPFTAFTFTKNVQLKVITVLWYRCLTHFYDISLLISDFILYKFKRWKCSKMVWLLFNMHCALAPFKEIWFMNLDFKLCGSLIIKLTFSYFSLLIITFLSLFQFLLFFNILLLQFMILTFQFSVFKF